jgi:hypothetical protein
MQESREGSMTGQRLQAEHGMRVERSPNNKMNDRMSPAVALVVFAVPDYQNDSAIGESTGWGQRWSPPFPPLE